jgi:rhodanese-related sulfurtransferase
MYYSNILCQDASRMLSDDPFSLLVDVRTEFEWLNLGKPKLTNMQQLLLNSLKIYPLMTFNENFNKILLESAKNKSKVFFLCRYGSRSSEAAKLAHLSGIDNCYNIVDGFEGNEYGLGWLKSNLAITFD